MGVGLSPYHLPIPALSGDKKGILSTVRPLKAEVTLLCEDLSLACLGLWFTGVGDSREVWGPSRAAGRGGSPGLGSPWHHPDSLS